MDPDPLLTGWSALTVGDWADARACFEESLAGGATPDAFEGLGFAAYFLDDAALTFASREQAYRLYLAAGDPSSAGRLAAWLAADYLEFRDEPAVSSGWLRRAHRLLDDLEPGPDHGWLAVHEGSIIIDEDAAAARQLGGYAVGLGRRFAVAELEVVGLALEGLAMVTQGELREGMRRLDEATTVALTGEAESLVCVAWAGCYLISACEQVRDYERAGQWCLRIGEFCRRHGIGILLGTCRAKYAGVLTWQGRWGEAEEELRSAADGLAAARPMLIHVATIRLAQLRRRQGLLAEAEELFSRCEGDARAILGRAEIALELGRHEEAADLADRYVRRFPDPRRTERMAGHEVAIRAHALLGRHVEAGQALEELREITGRAGTTPLRAALLASEGVVSAALGDHDAARRSFEDALDLFAVSEAPLEIALVRLDLAATLEALGRKAAAEREIEAALTALRKLGARRAASRAEQALRRLRGALPGDPFPRPDGPLSDLSKRELEVLALVAKGHTNREIARRLFLSEHTIHRHVNNILRKLAVPSRAAAASLAGRHGFA